MNSAIYRGWIRHRRFSPVKNSFTYRVFMLFLDLDEVPAVFDGRWLWSARRFAPAWFRRADYLGDRHTTLRQSVANLVESRTQVRPTGPIRLLTHLRYFGYSMNPVSFYYCFDEADTHVETIVAEITNTPWRERHTYVLSRTDDVSRRSNHFRFQFAKAFHVSPFMRLQQSYDWRFNAPDQILAVHMDNLEDGHKVFDATMALRRQPLTTGNLTRCLLRHPLMTLEVITKIHWQAARLWRKGCPVHSHPVPGHAAPAAAPS